MDSKVIVTANAEGHVVVRNEDNPDWGYIRVEQNRMDIDDLTGIAKLQKVSALIPGLVNDLRTFGFADKQEIEGKIRVVEQLTPFNNKYPDKDIKIAGRSGIACCVGDSPIYRKNFYTRNETLTDQRIAHTNEAEIKAAYASIDMEFDAL